MKKFKLLYSIAFSSILLSFCLYKVAEKAKSLSNFNTEFHKSMQPIFIFPKPTGPYTIGTKLFELTDFKRHNPDPDKTARKLVVQVWYPSTTYIKNKTAPYAYEACEEYKKALFKLGASSEKVNLLDRIRTYAISDAPIYNNQKLYPVIIFGHGIGAVRGMYSFFCEEIASHGYIVIMVMHTYITPFVRFFNGEEIKSKHDKDINAIIENCVADIQFVLDEIEKNASNKESVKFSPLGSLISLFDFKSIGMIGHSLGGVVTAQICRRDARVKVGINLDGPLWGINATKPFYKPCMFILSPYYYDYMSVLLEYYKNSLQKVGTTQKNFLGSVERFCRENSNNTMQIIAEGTTHMTFMDNAILDNFFEQIFAPSFSIKTLSNINQLQPPDILNTITKCIMTFFNQHLKNYKTAYPSTVVHDPSKEIFSFYVANKQNKNIEINLDPAILDKYVGQYVAGDTIFIVTKKENKLWIQIKGHSAYQIYPETETKFFFSFYKSKISFISDKKGDITKFILHKMGLDLHANKI